MYAASEGNAFHNFFFLVCNFLPLSKETGGEEGIYNYVVKCLLHVFALLIIRLINQVWCKKVNVHELCQLIKTNLCIPPVSRCRHVEHFDKIYACFQVINSAYQSSPENEQLASSLFSEIHKHLFTYSYQRIPYLFSINTDVLNKKGF